MSGSVYVDTLIQGPTKRLHLMPELETLFLHFICIRLWCPPVRRTLLISTAKFGILVSEHELYDVNKTFVL